MFPKNVNKRTIYEIKKLILEKEEYCGVFSDSFDFVFYKGLQKECFTKNENDYTNIWHTHSQYSKAYPSSHDIIKILKIKRLNPIFKRTSYIFTTWGIWIVSSKNRVKMNFTILENNIKKYLNEIYFKYYKNVSVEERINIIPDMDFIDFIIESIKTEINCCEFDMQLILWSELNKFI